MKKDTLLLIIVLVIVLFGKISAQTKQILIIDSTSSEPLVFANAYLQKNEKGASSDLEGLVVFKKEDLEYDSDSIVCSYIGYRDTTILIDFKNGKTLIKVHLQPLVHNLSEAVVTAKSISGFDIIKMAIKLIKDNYSETPVSLQGLYREVFYENGECTTLNEAVYDIFYTEYPQRGYIRKSSSEFYLGIENNRRKAVRKNKRRILWAHPQYFMYYNTVEDRCKINAARFNIPVSNDKTYLITSGGPLAMTSLDKVKYLADYLDPKLLNKYKYTKSGVKYIEDKLCYVIRFAPLKVNKEVSAPINKKMRYPIYAGSIYIDVESFAVLKIESILSPLAQVNRYKESSIVEYQFTDKNTLTINYQFINNKWYLKEVFSEQFLSPSQGKAAGESYSLMRHLLVDNVKTTNPKNFDSDDKDLFKEGIGYNLRVKDFEYDEEFWQDYEKGKSYLKLSPNDIEDLESIKPLSLQYREWAEN